MKTSADDGLPSLCATVYSSSLYRGLSFLVERNSVRARPVKVTKQVANGAALPPAPCVSLPSLPDSPLLQDPEGDKEDSLSIGLFEVMPVLDTDGLQRFPTLLPLFFLVQPNLRVWPGENW